MTGLLGGGETTTTQVNEPWKPSQKYLKDVMADAQKFYNSGRGFKAPPFQTWVPMSGQTTEALGGMMDMARQPNAIGNDAMGSISKLMAGGNISTKDDFWNLYGQDPNALAMFGTGIASGANGINTEGDYRSLFGQGPSTKGALENLLAGSGNDAWKGMVDTEAGKIADDVSGQFSNIGRFGSGAHTNALVGALGDFRQKAAAEEFNNNIARQRGLIGDITGLEERDIAKKLGIVGDITGVQGQNIANRLGAAGALSGEQQQGFANRRGLVGDVTNIEGSELDRSLSATGMAPSIYDLQYAPYDRMAQVGSAYDDLATRQLQAKVDKYTQNSMAPWNRLNAYSGLIGGPAGQGSSTTTTVQQPFDFSQLLGGNNPLLAALGAGLGLFGNI